MVGRLENPLVAIKKINIEGVYRRNHPLYPVMVSMVMSYSLASLEDWLNALLFARRAAVALKKIGRPHDFEGVRDICLRYSANLSALVLEKDPAQPTMVRYLIEELVKISRDWKAEGKGASALGLDL